jgi:hypothetical protein
LSVVVEYRGLSFTLEKHPLSGGLWYRIYPVRFGSDSPATIRRHSCRRPCCLSCCLLVIHDHPSLVTALFRAASYSSERAPPRILPWAESILVPVRLYKVQQPTALAGNLLPSAHNNLFLPSTYNNNGEYSLQQLYVRANHPRPREEWKPEREAY